MVIDCETLKREVEEMLEKNGVWVLSTSLHDEVTSRPMSIVHIGLDVYFQTNACYVKYEQMRENPNVALSCQNVSIQGVAQAIGNWDVPENAPVMALYTAKHPGSFKAYGSLEGQLVYKVTPTRIKLWKYEDGRPFREVMHVGEGRAERLDFM